ncbi:hypothetical protein [Dictyobacter vulcani]|uniref:hypothetical protein n=1 Tax=Dictyobacter vulcani TaxID=2607529 RepID=UPI001250CB26|nr:hypothetical protein [Dictyobacter vulcani]
MTSKHCVRGEGATRGGRTAPFAQASVQARLRSAVAPPGIVGAVACSRSHVVGERVDPPRTFSKRITTQDPSRWRRHRHALLVEPLAPRSRRMLASACGALSTYDPLLFSTMFFMVTKGLLLMREEVAATSAAGTPGSLLRRPLEQACLL